MEHPPEKKEQSFIKKAKKFIDKTVALTTATIATGVAMSEHGKAVRTEDALIDQTSETIDSKAKAMNLRKEASHFQSMFQSAALGEYLNSVTRGEPVGEKETKARAVNLAIRCGDVTNTHFPDFFTMNDYSRFDYKVTPEGVPFDITYDSKPIVLNENEEYTAEEKASVQKERERLLKEGR